jgi:cbb3-type cytochrome oxidase subunit 3
MSNHSKDVLIGMALTAGLFAFLLLFLAFTIKR